MIKMKNIKKTLAAIVAAAGIMTGAAGCKQKSSSDITLANPIVKTEAEHTQEIYETKLVQTDDFDVVDVRESSVYIENNRSTDSGNHPIQMMVVQNSGTHLGLINPYPDARIRRGSARVSYSLLKGDKINTEQFIRTFVKDKDGDSAARCGVDCWTIRADGIMERIEYNR